MFTDHGEQVRVVHGAVPVFALVQVWSVQDSGHHQAKVGSKGVDGHGAAGILCLKQSSVLRLCGDRVDQSMIKSSHEMHTDHQGTVTL